MCRGVALPPETRVKNMFSRSRVKLLVLQESPGGRAPQIASSGRQSTGQSKIDKALLRLCVCPLLFVVCQDGLLVLSLAAV